MRSAWASYAPSLSYTGGAHTYFRYQEQINIRQQNANQQELIFFRSIYLFRTPGSIPNLFLKAAEK